MDSYTVELDNETEKFVTLYLFTNVENADEIRRAVIGGTIQCCVLKAGLIVDPFQVIVAANKAVVNEKFGKLTTRSISAEILFNLSLSKNITQSLKTFGIEDGEKNIIVAIIHEADNRETLSKDALAIVKGQRTPITRLSEIADMALIKKTYKIQDCELNVSSLVEYIVSKMNIKTFASQ